MSTEASARREDRLSIVTSEPLRRDSLVGSYFHGDEEHQWQGVIVAEPAPGVYLCEFGSWASGSSTSQQLVRLEDMAGWHFYDDGDWWANHYNTSLKYRWERYSKDKQEASEGLVE